MNNLRSLIFSKFVIWIFISILSVLFSLFYFGIYVQKGLEQLNSYNNSNFLVIEKTSFKKTKNQFLEISTYSMFSTSKNKIRCETFMKLTEMEYDKELFSNANFENLKNNEILISKNLAKKFGIKVGDVLECDFSLQKDKIQYTVCGFFDYFYGLKEFNSSSNGVAIVGDNPNYSTQKNIEYTTFSNDYSQVFSKNSIFISDLEDKLLKFIGKNIIFTIIFLIFANFLFFIGLKFSSIFRYLSILRQEGGFYYKKKLSNFHFEFSVLISFFTLFLGLITSNIVSSVLIVVLFLVVDFLMFKIELLILRKYEV